MAEPLDLTGIAGLSADKEELCTIEASCVTGFEAMAAEEVEAVLGAGARQHRGRVVFDLPLDRAPEVLGLRCVNTVWVMLGHTPDIQYPEGEQQQLETLMQFAESRLDWRKGLEVWRRVTGFQGELAAEQTSPEASSPKASKLSPPTFRCTCYRSGTNHKFKSTEAQSAVGGRVQEKFGWPVSCKGYDLEFVINCDVKQVYCCINLTNVSLFNRTVTSFGPCTLKPTICAGLVRLARLEAGEVVLDPMCGGGTISLEGSCMGPQFHLGGELHQLAVQRCRENQAGLSNTATDFLQWDCLLPALKDNSVDVVITDLPFGKRSGSRADNRVLYPRTLLSLARVVRPTTGRAVLLTQDKNSMFKTFKQVNKYWKHTKQIVTNIGGLTALVFLISRTGVEPSEKL